MKETTQNNPSEMSNSQAMVINDKVIVKNYKCFGEEGGGFERIMPINIIIGKNNSGKSSLIDSVEYLTSRNKEFNEKGRYNSRPSIIISHKLKESEIEKVFRKDTRTSDIPSDKDYGYGMKFINKEYVYEFNSNNQYQSINADFVTAAIKHIHSLGNVIDKPLSNKTFCKILAERDINPEKYNGILNFQSNGGGATNYIQCIINKKDEDSLLIEEVLRDELNRIVMPDIEFSRILVQIGDDDIWELFFEDKYKKRIPLSKMGSGVKTVLLVLLNLIVRPQIEKKDKNEYVFAFEELENNLHPSLQRRLYDYIIEYSKANSTYFFLTTHSNIVIDAFSNYDNAQLIHVTNDGNKATTTTISSYHDTKQALSDLGIKASDLLQSNGVIWVEGPSDRNYLNKWLSLLAPELKEGLHYSIMFYGGRLLANLSFNSDYLADELIPLLRINTNAFVLIDRDGNGEAKPITKSTVNKTKDRIAIEIGEANVWITEGREIENYLSDTVVSKWLSEEHGYVNNFLNSKNEKLENSIAKASSKMKLKYNEKKNPYSAEIVKYIDEASLDVYDLRKRLLGLVKIIESWNK